MTTQDVEREVIRKMAAAFPAPTHVRGNEEATETLLNVYRRALERFDAPVLRMAWQKAAAEQTHWIWPIPGDIVAAAESFQRQMHPGGDDAWVEEARALAESYWKRYSKCTAAVKARECGYEPALRAFVTEAAWVQAQMILGRQGYAYDHAALFPGRERDRGAEDEWFVEARRQAETGEIKVLLPRGKTAGWRAEAQGEGRRR